MSPTSRFPRPTTSDITKIGIELPAEASEALDRELEFEQVESREARTHRLSTGVLIGCLLYTSPSPRDRTRSRMPSSA